MFATVPQVVKCLGLALAPLERMAVVPNHFAEVWAGHFQLTTFVS